MIKTIHVLSLQETITQLQSDIDYVQPMIESIVNSPKPHNSEQVDAYRNYRMIQINAQNNINNLLNL